MIKTLFRSVILVAIFSIITRVLGFLFRIYLSRELGAELLGVYYAAFSVFMVLIILVSSGIPLAISKLTAKYKVTKNNKAEYGVVTAGLIVGLIISLIVCFVIFLFRNNISKVFTDDRTIFILITLLPSVVFSAVYSAFRGSLWGTKNYFSVCIAELIEQVIRIIAFFVLANIVFDTTMGAINAGISMSIGCLCSAIFIMIIYFCDKRKLCNPKNFYPPLLKSALPVTGVRTVSSLIQPIIAVLFPYMLVLNGVSNEESMELFGVAMGMTFPLLFIPSTLIGALGFTLIPELSTALAKKENELVKERVRSSLIFSLLVSCLAIPFFMGAGEGIGEFLYDNKLSGEYLVKAAWIMIPMGLSNITSSILNTYNLEVRSFIHNIMGGLILLLCIVCLSGVCGVECLIWGFGGCMTLTTILNLRLLVKKTGYDIQLFRPILLLLIFIIPSSLLTNQIYNLCICFVNQFFALVISGIVSLVSYILMLIIFNVVNISMFLHKINIKNKLFTHKN